MIFLCAGRKTQHFILEISGIKSNEIKTNMPNFDETGKMDSEFDFCFHC